MKYAIIESGGKQYKAVEGESIDVDRLAVEPGVELKLEHVLLLVDGEAVTVGTPYITGMSVLAKVLAHVKGEKLTVFKYRPKKRIRVKTGHRQTYTRLLIDQVGDAKAEKVEKPAKAKKPVMEKTAKEKKPVVEKTVKLEKAAPVKKTTPAKKATVPAKTEKKPAVKKTTKTEKKPAVKKTTKTEKK
jgi:large subunit ribosomal protein L21